MGKKKNPPVPPGACVFCRSETDNILMYGKFIHKENFSAHEHCLFFSSGLKQTKPETEDLLGFSIENIQKEVFRGSKLKCVFCKANRATIGCSNTVCRKSFHYECGMKNHTLYQHFDSFKAFCASHKLKQKNMKVPNEEFFCRICFSSLVDEDSNSYLYTACCKKYFHFLCVQEYAYNAGKYFFKCPICNNKKEFSKEMLLHGIHIPIKDASWELEENAYQELLFRPGCNSTICKCEKGTKFSDEGKWTLLPCKLCGSQARHRVCADLDEDTWICDDCSSPVSSSSHHPTSVSLQIEEKSCLESGIEAPIYPEISRSGSIANKSEEGDELEDTSPNCKTVKTITGLGSKRKLKATSTLSSVNTSDSSNKFSTSTEAITADSSTKILDELPKISSKRKKKESKERIGKVLKQNNLSGSNIFEDKICPESNEIYRGTTSSLKPITNTFNTCSITGTTNVKLEKKSNGWKLSDLKKERSVEEHKFVNKYILSESSVEKASKKYLSYVQIGSTTKQYVSKRKPVFRIGCSPLSSSRCIKVMCGLPCPNPSHN